ncbi:hypothetical cytosolic protein [Syntrophus aciditrophicus SB]|uniref:Hypothetical cytosolic protein n=1 Tax=Syntrophus aciditrophicus (strain SB) TaxID=56780 RepID=Q2LWQ7_SYNAS|nr:hypothetical cytosolic protein [Syntrophus aciditrophicus SB]
MKVYKQDNQSRYHGGCQMQISFFIRHHSNSLLLPARFNFRGRPLTFFPSISPQTKRFHHFILLKKLLLLC